MIYLLDANAVISVLNAVDSPVSRSARRHAPRDIGISAIAVYELFYGAFRSQRVERNVALVDSLHFEIVAFGKEDSRSAGEVRAHLAVRGALIGPYDILIAGQARARDLILVTHNTREFGRVPGLQIEDWEA